MIEYNKIIEANKLNQTIIFIFMFTDGNYYYEYNKDDNFEIRKGGRKDRGYIEEQLYYYIPINRLIKM